MGRDSILTFAHKFRIEMKMAKKKLSVFGFAFESAPLFHISLSRPNASRQNVAITTKHAKLWQKRVIKRKKLGRDA